MTETAGKAVRLSKVTRDFNLGVHTVVEFLAGKGHVVEASPNTKIPGELYALLEKEFGQDKAEKAASKQVIQERQEREAVVLPSVPEPAVPAEEAPPAPAAEPQQEVVPAAEKAPEPKEDGKKPAEDLKIAETPAPPAATVEEVKAAPKRVPGVKTLGKIDLEARKAPKPAKTAKAPE
ncbi:MAG TPA: hypothetical protein PLV70_13395, partial [Flavobacteriales bacterium]|nr:hypothetical protein [Flavobacteriales bacterium]